MSKIQEQFGDFTEIFSADGYQFIQMRSFLENIEAKQHKTQDEIAVLEAFRITSRLCRAFLDRNPIV